MAASPSAVFLIKSPLQYLNALEAISFFELRPEETLWVFLSDSKTQKQLGPLVERDTDGKLAGFLSALPLMPGAESFVAQPCKGGHSIFGNALFSVFKLTRLAKLYPHVPLVFIGDLANPLMRHYVNSLKKAKVVHLDDGVATLNYAQKRHAIIQRKVLSMGKRLKFFLKRKLLGLIDDEIAEVTFFTLYHDLQVGALDRVVVNDFSCLRNDLKSVSCEEVIYFLGGPLVEAKFLDENAYLALLRRVAEYYAGKQVVYVAHRREDQRRLDLIRQETGWQTRLFEFPIEYQLAKVGPRPIQLASFFSSGLETCQQIFGPELETRSFALTAEVLNAMPAAKRQVLAALYQRLEQLMPVINLAED